MLFILDAMCLINVLMLVALLLNLIMWHALVLCCRIDCPFCSFCTELEENKIRGGRGKVNENSCIEELELALISLCLCIDEVRKRIIRAPF